MPYTGEVPDRFGSHPPVDPATIFNAHRKSIHSVERLSLDPVCPVNAVNRLAALGFAVGGNTLKNR